MQIESVQKKFTKRIPDLAGLTYKNRLISLKLPTLELRRLRNDLILCYKILNGHVAGSPEKYGILLSDRQSRGHNQKISIQHVRVDVRKHFFGCRIAEPWNSLPLHVVNADSILIFKRLLCDFNLDKFLII